MGEGIEMHDSTGSKYSNQHAPLESRVASFRIEVSFVVGR